MSSAALQYLAILSGVTTVVVSFVVLARAPLRGTVGARAGYWLWLAVPASALALALPRVARPNGEAAMPAADVFGWVWARVDALLAAIHVSGRVGSLACALWAAGACATLAVMVLRQRSFARSLGTLVALPDGTWRSSAVAEPMLVGAWRPRVLVPLDFEQRYNAEEREFVLAHERAHMRRGDTLVNAFGAAWLCVFWFNPVMSGPCACCVSIRSSRATPRCSRWRGRGAAVATPKRCSRRNWRARLDCRCRSRVIGVPYTPCGGVSRS